MTMRRARFTVVLAVCAAGLARAATVTLPVAEVAEAADPQTKTFPAKVLPLQRVDVTPEVSGDIIEVCFKDGALVKANDVLYKLLPIKYKSALKNAEARVAECKARKAFADAAYERHTKLAAGAVSQNAMDSVKSDRETATAALAAAEAELEVADYNLRRCQIRTPIDGRTGTTRLTKGNPASPSTPLVTVVQIQPIRVRFSISNADFLNMFGARGKTIAEKGEVSVTLANGTPYGEKRDAVRRERRDRVYGEHHRRDNGHGARVRHVPERGLHPEALRRRGRDAPQQGRREEVRRAARRRDAGRGRGLRVGGGQGRQGREAPHRARSA